MSGFVISNAKSIRKKSGKRWVSFPSKEWVKSDGTKSYSPLIEFADRSIADKFSKRRLALG